MSGLRKIERALISVSDKSGITDLARVLAEHGIEILSTGGTAKTLREAGIRVTDVSDVTGFPEMMDGRVKTLHPKIHGALLALRGNRNHVDSLREHNIDPIDMLVVNLYPFEQTVAGENVSLADAIENIDIGGPAMIRSAAKNWSDVAVVTDPRLYPAITGELSESSGSLSLETRQRLAALAFTRTAAYDLAISGYLARQLTNEDLEFLEPLNPLAEWQFIEPAVSSERDEPADAFEDSISLDFEKITDLRYGENPHQLAALYETTGAGRSVAGAEQLSGKEMSFNNYVDADAAWNLIREFDETACAIIKHTNPSGVGLGVAPLEAYRRALSTDPVSAFGGIVAFNQTVDEDSARAAAEIFTEVVIAPDFSEAALKIFGAKKNLRVLKMGSREGGQNLIEYKQISGGMLAQSIDDRRLTQDDLKTATRRQPTNDEIEWLLFAWKVCKHVKSNAIVLASDGRTLGVGAGQMNRVDSIRIAALRAERFNLPLIGSVLASDAFFPFRDNIDEAARLGISAIIQPGGSVRDAEVIEACDDNNIAMVLTGVRHFKH
jgi:phosphoribosylaminoimidazolecarboxamide formyltransferase / IMP cyclohydrolase